MKANRLPTAEELPQDRTLEERTVALDRAIRATRLLTGKYLEVTEKKETILLSRDPYQLKWPANEAPTARSKDGQTALLDYDYHINTIYPTFDAEEYELTYTTGYAPGTVPAVTKELVKLLATWFLLKDEQARTDAIALLEVAKGLR